MSSVLAICIPVGFVVFGLVSLVFVGFKERSKETLSSVFVGNIKRFIAYLTVELARSLYILLTVFL